MLYEFISDQMAGRYVKFKEDGIWFGDVRCSFNILPIMERELLIYDLLGNDTHSAAVFISARKAGYDFIKEHAMPLSKSWTPMMRLGVEWLALFGQGTFRMLRGDNKNGLMVMVGRSSIALTAKSIKPTGSDPVDFVVGGLMAGAIQYYTKTPVYAVETSCIAQKDVNECTLVAGSRKTITDYVKQFSPDKMGWADRMLDSMQAVEKTVEEMGDKRWLLKD